MYKLVSEDLAIKGNISKDTGKMIFYYISHPLADIMRKIIMIKMYVNKNNKWGLQKLNIISIKPYKKKYIYLNTEERQFFISLKSLEKPGHLTNILKNIDLNKN